jgi:hypothetical protein
MSDFFDWNAEVTREEYNPNKISPIAQLYTPEVFADMKKPQDEGFLTELGQSFVQNVASGYRNIGSFVKKTTGYSGIRDYYQGILEENPQWNTPENLSKTSYVARAIGGGAGSTVPTLTATMGGTLLGGPGAGFNLGVATTFANQWGEAYERNISAGYGEDKATAFAIPEALLGTTLEHLSFGIIGKGGKLIKNAGRMQKISAAGKKELLDTFSKKLVAEVGKKEAKNLMLKYGINIAKGGAGEGTTELLQYVNSYMFQKLGDDPNAQISVDEAADTFLQAFIAGGFFEGVTGAPGIRREAKMRKLVAQGAVTPGTQVTAPGTPASPDGTVLPENQTPAVDDTQIDGVAPEGNIQPEANTGTETQLFDTLIADVGNELGINIDFMDTRPDGAELQESKNGFYDSNNKTLYLNRNTYERNPAETLGHELKHYVDDTAPELSKAFDELISGGLNDLGIEFNNAVESGNAGDINETSADIFGQIFARPETWQKTANQLEMKTPGMGEKFLQVLRDFIALVKTKLAKLKQDPRAEQMLNNFNQVEAEAVRMLTELRRRNGNSTQIENVVGAKGNTAVETVPVSQINVDAKRFQFKSNTSKLSGVDESNKLGGDWDARTAGNLYLWQDKSGKIYVVNGHHRLELAQRNGVENINAIIDREADGVTAEQARRNGVLINIRDGQGEVRDYAAFVRDEKLSAEEAEAQGVTARQKGRAGFLLGKSGNTLYEAYRNEVIPESKAVIIAEVAQGNEAIEYAGIKLATDRKLAGEALRQTLKLAAQNASGKKADTTQGSLFDMVDDSVLQEWELIGKAAAKHIKDIRTRIEAAKDAIKNPEAAKSLGVKTTKGAEKLLSQAQQELARWENYATDSELMAQLREEAGIAPQEVVSETEKTTDKNGQKPTETDNDVISAENVQTTAKSFYTPAHDKFGKHWKQGEKERLYIPYQKFFDIYSKISGRKDTPREIISSPFYDYKTGELYINSFGEEGKTWNKEKRQYFGKIFYNDILNSNSTSSAENAQTAEKATVSKKEKVEPVVKENLTTETAATTEESSEIEETPEEIERKRIQKIYKNLKDRSAEIGFTFDEFYQKFQPSLNAIMAKARNKFSQTLGNDIEAEWESAANKALMKAYMDYDPAKGAKIKTSASTYVVNAINDVNRKHKANFKKTGGNISLDQTNEQGEALSEAVADENASAIKKEQSKDLIGDYRKWKSTLNEKNQRILELSESGMAPSEIGRAAGIGMTTEEVHARLKKLMEEARDAGLVFSSKRGQHIEEVNRKFNDDLDRQIAGTLPKGYIHQLGTPGDILLSTGVPDLPIELSATRLMEKSKQDNHPFDIAELKNLPQALQNPIAVFAYGNPAKVQNIIVEIQSKGKNYLVGLSLNSEFRGIAVNDIRGLFPKDLHEWLTWIQDGKSLYLNKEKVQNLITQQRINLAEVSYLDLNSVNNIIQNFKNPSADLEFSRKRLHNQINPAVRDGVVRQEFADLL